MRPLLLPLACAAALASCGGSDSGGSDAGRGSKDPEAVLKDVQAALKDVESYHVEGTQDDADGHNTVNGDVAADGNVRFAIDTGGRKLSVVVAGDKIYMRGNSAFWEQQGGAALARRLGDQWIDAPDDLVGSLRTELDQLRPDGLADCITNHKGTLTTRSGGASVGGKRAIVIVDKGDQPGDSPGELYVQAEGAALPLRVRQTGKRVPGGKLDPKCDDADSTTTRSDLTLSRFDEDVTIEAPKDPKSLEELQRDAGKGGEV